MGNSSEKEKQTRLVWDIVKQIPKGRVTTYGDVAKLAGLIGQARFVGHALNKLPHGTKIPWHRVINSQGKISFPPVSSAYGQQKKLLEKEGIVFKGNRVELEKYCWLKDL